MNNKEKYSKEIEFVKSMQGGVLLSDYTLQDLLFFLNEYKKRKVMDTLIRERNGREEIWYSDEYLRRQIEMAYQAGLSKGITVEIHAIQPIDGEAVNNLTDEFNKRRVEEYQKAYNNEEVWRIAK